MKRNKKLTILALSAMLVMTLAVTIISFSLANQDNNDSGSSDTVITADASSTLTNIDYIIKASANADADSYKIVEIGSKEIATEDGASEPYTDFGLFAEKGNFKDYVIDGNRTIEDLMQEGKIDYVYYYAADVTDDNEAALADISSADFVYVSNDSSKPYSKSNDINEELYNILHIYAVGDYKPFIIESPASSGSSDFTDTTTGLTFTDLVNDYFTPAGYLYSTFYWPEDMSAQDFYTASLSSESLYVAISGRAKMSGWLSVKTTSEADESFEMAEILVVSKNGGTLGTTTEIGNSALSGAVAVDSLYDKNTGEAVELNSNQKLYDIGNTVKTPFYSNGYSARYSAYKPEYVRVTEVTLAELEAGYAVDGATSSDATTSQIDYAAYDLVIFQDDCAGVSLSTDLYKKLVGAMYGSVQMIYSESLTTSTSSNTGTSEELETSNDTNYEELFYMVATEDGIERYPNIMITDKTEMDVIISSKSAATCKIIADLINSSSFRGIGGPGQTSNLYTVLEIQPCYPIDTALAEKFETNGSSKAGVSGDYYTSPSDMVNGKTREQLGIASDEDLTKDTPQYYAWELSEAKVAELTGLDVSQVKVVHMSTEELATSKVDILGNYDLVYIGGNTTALLDATNYWSVNAYQCSFYSSCASLNTLLAAPIYSMYSHNGDIVSISTKSAGEGGSVRSGSPFAAATYEYATEYKTEDINGVARTYVNSFTTYNGNDITRLDLEGLIEYVDAGMPLVISSDLYAAYDIMNKATDSTGASNRYFQNSIDPDSNICEFLDYCNTLTNNGAKSILWNFNQKNTEQVDNDGGRLGDTAIGTVEVFTGDDRENLEDLINTSTLRPKLAVTSMPATYNMYDKSTRLNSTILKFEYEVSNVPSNYTVNLYIDYNKDGVFSSDDFVDNGGDNSLTFNLADDEKYGADYYGPIYWQIEVVATYGKKESSAVTNGICYIDGKSVKQKVNVLQIIPDDTSYGNSTGMQGTTTLLFCTECQRALKVLKYNPVSDSELDAYSNVYDGHITDNGKYIDANGYANIFTTGNDAGDTTNQTNIYMGRHDHDFGIVKYDSTKTMSGSTVVGMDNWDENLADEIADLYDFDIDILTSREYEDINKQVQNDVNTMIATLNANGEIKNSSVDTLTADEKAVLKAAFLEEASVYEVAYNTAVAEVEEAEQKLQDTLDVMIANSTARAGYDYKEQFESIKQSERYGDFYMIWGTSWNGTYPWNDLETIFSDGVNYTDLYNNWTAATDAMLEAKDSYDRYYRAANYENWLLGCYQCIIIGPAEDFNGDDIYDEDINNGYGALDVLEGYVKGNGTIILFHDTLTKFSDVGSVNLTTRLRAAFGQDKNHMNTLDETIVEASGNSSSLYYLPYEVDDNYSEDTYFMTNLSFKPTSDTTRYLSWLSDIKEFSGNDYLALLDAQGRKGYLTTTAYTDGYLLSTSTYGNTPIMYKYAEYSWGVAAIWNNSAAATASSGANRATQVNKGLVTMYPFTLSDRLNISPTHVQAYALDLEPENMSVWYTLAGGTYGNNGASSIHAASPNDGTDSYFIYSYGNVFYCGAGHAEVTGALKDNNDERRLYINVICNSTTNVPVTTVSAYDYGTTTNNTVKKNGNEYLYQLGDSDDVAEFSFKFVLGMGLNLKNVNVYYDIDENGVYSEGDVYIKQYSSSDVESSKLINVPVEVDNNYAITSTVTISEDGYKTLENGGYIKIRNNVSLLDKNNNTLSATGDEWITLTKDSFTKDEDSYTADVKVNFTDKSGKLTDINFDMMGVGFNSGVSIGNVNVVDVSNTSAEDTVIYKNSQSVVVENVNFSSYTQDSEESMITVGYDNYTVEIKPEYLTNGKYVYIVIEVVTDKGTTRKKIRVEISDKLYNLT